MLCPPLPFHTCGDRELGRWKQQGVTEESNARLSPWVQVRLSHLPPALYLYPFLGPRDIKAWRETVPVPGNPAEIQDLGDGVPFIM